MANKIRWEVCRWIDFGITIRSIGILKFEVLPWCSAIQTGWRWHTRSPLLGSRQDDGAMHMRIVATPVEPLLVKPPSWWLPTQEDSSSDISQFVEMPTQVSRKYDINFDQLWLDVVSSSHAFVAAGRPYHHHHHWGRNLIDTHLRQIEATDHTRSRWLLMNNVRVAQKAELTRWKRPCFCCS